MSLITRCPVCGTAFRVQSSQLAAHSGTVRCGKCSAVFNGVAALVEEDEERLALEPSPQLGLFDPSRRGAAEEAAGGDAPVPDFLAAPERDPRRRLWIGAAALALIVLAGQVTYRVDKAGIIHCIIGKSKFEANQLKDNLLALINDLNKAKPATSKGIYLKKITVSSTMGPGVIIDQASLGL